MTTKYPDFQFENHPFDRKVRLLTPVSYTGHEYALKHMRGLLRWGKSFVLNVPDAEVLQRQLQDELEMKVNAPWGTLPAPRAAKSGKHRPLPPAKGNGSKRRY